MILNDSRYYPYILFYKYIAYCKHIATLDHHFISNVNFSSIFYIYTIIIFLFISDYKKYLVLISKNKKKCFVVKILLHVNILNFMHFKRNECA